ncbi:MAG: branched-chain amino acid ABC transporter permease [Anaerolineales bacterium]
MQDDRLGRRHPLVQLFLDNWVYIAIAILVWQLPYLLGDYFDQGIRPRRPAGNQPVFWMGVFIELYILMILAMSYNLVFGFGGIISFGHALFFGTGVYVIIIFLNDFAVTIPQTIVVALALSALLGLLASVAAFRIKGVYFAMFTLALSQVFFELSRVNLFKSLTEGDDGRTITGLPEWINPIQNRLGFYYIAAFLMGFTYFTIRRLMNSPSGRAILAIRDNEQRAQTMGYNVALYKTLVIVASSLFATLAGILHALFVRQADPTQLGLNRTVDPLFMTIIGGVGTNPGPAIGAFIIHMGEEFFRKPDLEVDLNFILFHIRGTVDTVEIWRLVLGIAFILIVLFIPYGIIGEMNRLWLQIRRWFRIYVYDRLLRANPAVAERMQFITGESPAYALALAERSRGASLLAWAREHPGPATLSIALVVAGLGGLLNWQVQTFFSLLLFSLLIVVPLTVAIWLARNHRLLSERLRETLDTMESRLQTTFGFLRR